MMEFALGGIVAAVIVGLWPSRSSSSPAGPFPVSICFTDQKTVEKAEVGGARLSWEELDRWDPDDGSLFLRVDQEADRVILYRIDAPGVGDA